MRQMGAVAVRRKAELHHPHAGETGRFQQPFDVLAEYTEILRDNRQRRKLPRCRVKQRLSRPRQPRARFRGFGVRRHRPVRGKCPEMVDAHHVKTAERIPLHGRPVVQRIAPKLAVRRKIIRRHPRDTAGTPGPRVKVKPFPVAPDIAAVHRYIHRHVADNTDAFAVDIGFQLLPFLGKEPLDKHMIVRCSPQRRLLAAAGIIRQFIRPLPPGRTVLPFLRCHKQRIRLHPRVFCRKSGALFPLLCTAPCIGRTQNRLFLFCGKSIIRCIGAAGITARFFLLPGNQAAAQQGARVDIQGISGKRAHARIRRIAHIHRIERQHLPKPETHAGEGIRKPASLFSEPSDTVRSRQGRNVHQYTRAALFEIHKISAPLPADRPPKNHKPLIMSMACM